MGWAAFMSDGKDLILATRHARDERMEVDCPLMIPPETRDSCMFHSANLDAVAVGASVSGLEYREVRTLGGKKHKLHGLDRVLTARRGKGIITGAVVSEYQRQRLDNFAKAHDIQGYVQFLHRDPEFLPENVPVRMDDAIIMTAAYGFDKRFLGGNTDSGLICDLEDAGDRHHIQRAGDGGYSESPVSDAPFHRRPVTSRSTVNKPEGSPHEPVPGGFS